MDKGQGTRGNYTWTITHGQLHMDTMTIRDQKERETTQHTIDVYKII